MGYQHIKNLYADQRILEFKRCFALEKIHGTSARVSWKPLENTTPDQIWNGIKFFSGGERYEKFLGLFDQSALAQKFNEKFGDQIEVTVYGEAYGGSQQG